MRFLSIAAASIVALIPHIAVADCIGLFNEPEPGYRLGPGGHINKTEEMVTAGTKMKFKGIGLLNNKSYLARSQSDLVYDAYNIELTSNCSLPLVDLTKR